MPADHPYRVEWFSAEKTGYGESTGESRLRRRYFGARKDAIWYAEQLRETPWETVLAVTVYEKDRQIWPEEGK